MRSEKEVYDIVLNFAKTDKRIRMVTLEGSRTNTNIPPDDFQDFDITFFVTDMDSFTSDDKWLDIYDSSVHTSTQITDFYWHMENIYTSIVILRSQYRRDCQAINELFISAERKAMLDELIRSIGEPLQQKIKNNVVFLDSNGQLE